MTTPRILHDNRLADGVVTATTTATGYSPQYLVDWREYTYWRSSSAATQYLTVDCGSAKSADAFCLANHNIGTLGGSLSVECSSDNFSADTTVAVAEFAPSHDGPLVKLFSGVAKRYWRIKISGLSGECYIANAAVGVVVLFPCHLAGSYTPRIISPSADAVLSADGCLLGVMRGITMARSRWEFERLPDAWYRENLRPLWEDHLYSGLPAFFIPSAESQPDDVFLYRVVAESGFGAPVVKGGQRRVGLELRGVYAPVVTSPVIICNLTGWVIRAAPFTDLWAIDWSPSLEMFAAIVSDDGWRHVLTSVDGVTWINAAPATDLRNSWRSMRWMPSWGMFLAIGNNADGDNRYFYSYDGVSWLEEWAWGELEYAYVEDLTDSQSLGKQVAVGLGPSLSPSGFSCLWVAAPKLPGESDGFIVRWYEVPLAEVLQLRAVIWVEPIGIFVAVGDQVVVTSPDALTWTVHAINSGINFRDVTFSPELGLLVAVGNYSSGANSFLATSTNGADWQVVVSQLELPLQLNSIEWIVPISKFVAVTANYAGTNKSYVGTSADGINWIFEVSVIPAKGIMDMAFSESLNMVAAVGYGAAGQPVMTSTVACE